MLRGDSGEFQWAMVSLNVAHATGYPLFTLLGYFWQLLPLSNNIAWQLNILATFFGALAGMMIFIFLRSITQRSDAALIGALFFALSPVIWFNASILEVYTLHAFLLALILYLLWQWSQTFANPALSKTSVLWLYLAFLILGLALAHHRLIVLALPAILYFLLATDRRFFFNIPRLLICALLLIPGLLFYLYIPLRLLPEGFTLDYAISDIILGREYAGSFLRDINPSPVLLEIPIKNFGIGLILALLGTITLCRRALHLNIALWLIYLLNVAFALVYSVPDIEVFLTSSFVVTAIWIGAGTAFLLEWISTRVGVLSSRQAQIALALILLLLPLFNLTRLTEIQIAVANEAAPEARARAIAAASLPPGAFLELDWETATALRFLQTTESLRPDLEARLIHMDTRNEYWRALQNVDAGRPVFIEQGVKWTRAPAGYTTAPKSNELVEVLSAPSDLQGRRSPINNRVELVGYHAGPDAFILYWRVNQPLGKDVATFIHYLDASGNKIGQEDHAACCEAVYGYRTSEWEAEHIYADTFKPPPAQATSFEIGMYENANGDIEPYGETITLKP